MGGGGLDNLQRSLPTQPWSAPASFGPSPSRTVFLWRGQAELEVPCSEDEFHI